MISTFEPNLNVVKSSVIPMCTAINGLSRRLASLPPLPPSIPLFICPSCPLCPLCPALLPPLPHLPSAATVALSHGRSYPGSVYECLLLVSLSDGAFAFAVGVLDDGGLKHFILFGTFSRISQRYTTTHAPCDVPSHAV